VHGNEADSAASQSLYDRAKSTAHNAAESIRGVFGERDNTVNIQGEEIVEVRTHSLEESVMHMPSAGQDGVASRTVKTESDTAHTWEQQHEGGLGHRAKETVRGAAETVGEKAVEAVEVIKDKAGDVQDLLAETGHNARVKIDDALERNFGATAERIQAQGEKARLSAVEDTARGAELVQAQFGGAASSLKDQERTELQKTEAQKLQQYHSGAKGPLDNTLDSQFGNIAHEFEVEGQKTKESAIHDTARFAELIGDEFGNAASSLRDQQRNEQTKS
jgi:hypothetical protein